MWMWPKMLDIEAAGRGAVGVIWRKWDLSLLRNSEGLGREVVLVNEEKYHKLTLQKWSPGLAYKLF